MTDSVRPPGRTELRLWFRVWGKDVSPEALTEATGITPTRAFQIGEARGAYAKTIAGWEWVRDGWTDVETDPLFAEALAVLGPHEVVFAASRAAGAEVVLSLGGYVYGDIIASASEADRRGFYVSEEEPFRPYFQADRVEFSLSPDVLGFLGRTGATFTTHIDAVLDDDT
jgi:hypothetical protein